MVENDTSADAEATVKAYQKRDGRVWLMPQPGLRPHPRRQREDCRQGGRRAAPPHLMVTVNRQRTWIRKLGTGRDPGRMLALLPGDLPGVP